MELDVQPVSINFSMGVLMSLRFLPRAELIPIYVCTRGRHMCSTSYGLTASFNTKEKFELVSMHSSTLFSLDSYFFTARARDFIITEMSLNEMSRIDDLVWSGITFVANDFEFISTNVVKVNSFELGCETLSEAWQMHLVAFNYSWRRGRKAICVGL
jgi:hypothetical protein